METPLVAYTPKLLPGATITKAIKLMEISPRETFYVQFQPLLPTPEYLPSRYAQQQYLWQQQSQSTPYLPLQQAPTFPEDSGIQSPKLRGSLSRVFGSMWRTSSSSSSRRKRLVHRTPTPATAASKKVAKAYKEIPEIAAFWKIANETAQKLKEVMEQTSSEAQKALTDMVNFQIQYHQQRKDDQETTVHNLEALKDELLGQMQQQYNDFDDRLDQQWAALDIKVHKGSLATKEGPRNRIRQPNQPPRRRIQQSGDHTWDPRETGPGKAAGSSQTLRKHSSASDPSYWTSSGSSGGRPPFGGRRPPPPRDPSPPRQDPKVPLRVNIPTFKRMMGQNSTCLPNQPGQKLKSSFGQIDGLNRLAKVPDQAFIAIVIPNLKVQVQNLMAEHSQVMMNWKEFKLLAIFDRRNPRTTTAYRRRSNKTEELRKNVGNVDRRVMKRRTVG
ncbi:hypothetical protein BDZ91DRAFT_804559 [Kalaharituber pfeilii]|nr:hypothetical protein BDZ91DRAFT_804559 [Kalaharituber pfeilii]